MNFNEVEKKVIKIVNEIDPDNLVSFGAPADEYLTQVHKIIGIITNVKDQNLWEREFIKVFFPKAEHRTKISLDKIKELAIALQEAFPQGIDIEH